MDAEDGVGLVVFLAEKVFQLELIELLLGGIDLRRNPLLRLTEVDEHGRVGDFLVEGRLRVEFAANRGRFVQDRAGFGLIGPKSRAGHDVL